MPQSSNVLSFVPVPNLEPGPRRNSAPQHANPEFAGVEDEAVLRKIAEAALSATGADGAALALRRGGFVVCVARAGGMAPPLGARLDDTSGMSGECLREGQALRCDDTETDARVDAEACRSLGLRSVAVLVEALRFHRAAHGSSAAACGTGDGRIGGRARQPGITADRQVPARTIRSDSGATSVASGKGFRRIAGGRVGRALPGSAVGKRGARRDLCNAAPGRCQHLCLCGGS